MVTKHEAAARRAALLAELERKYGPLPAARATAAKVTAVEGASYRVRGRQELEARFRDGRLNRAYLNRPGTIEYMWGQSVGLVKQPAVSMQEVR